MPARRPRPTPHELRDLAVDVASAGAALAVEMRSSPLDVATKSTGTDLVTDADRAVEALIRGELARRRPTDEILGEEEGQAAPTEPVVPESATPEAGAVRWVVDPIDGTTNFVYGHPGWAVSVAAELGGVVVAGAVVDPTHGDVFAAARGAGATRNDVPLELGPPAPLDRLLLATGFGYAPERRGHQARALVHVLPQVRDIRRMGAASVDLCSVGCGRVDAYFEWGLQRWDWSAGALVAAESGARVGDVDGGELRVEGRILACHPDRWDELVAMLEVAGA